MRITYWVIQRKDGAFMREQNTLYTGPAVFHLKREAQAFIPASRTNCRPVQVRIVVVKPRKRGKK